MAPCHPAACTFLTNQPHHLLSITNRTILLTNQTYHLLINQTQPSGPPACLPACCDQALGALPPPVLQLTCLTRLDLVDLVEHKAAHEYKHNACFELPQQLGELKGLRVSHHGGNMGEGGSACE